MIHQHETTPQISTPQVTRKPICNACSNGYHDQVLVSHEGCSCPCHGPLNVQAEVAA